MLKSPEHYSIAELIQSLEKELEDLRAQGKHAQNKKPIGDLEDRLRVLGGLLVVNK